MRKLIKNPLVLLSLGFMAFPIVALLQIEQHNRLVTQAHADTSTNYLAALFILIQIVGLISLIAGVILGMKWLARKDKK